MTEPRLKILCIDDEADILELYRAAIEQAGYEAVLCVKSEEAIAVFHACLHELVLVLADYQMPGMNGFQLREALLPQGLKVPFVIVSSYVSREMALQAIDLKIDAFFDKPISDEAIRTIISKHGEARATNIKEAAILEMIFLEEAGHIVEELDDMLLSLEHDRENPDKLNLIFRGAHTIKGSSGILSTDIMTRYVHKYEDIISSVKNRQQVLTDEVFEILLKGFDRIKELLGAVRLKTINQYRLEDILPDLALGKSQVLGAKAQPTPPPAVRSGGGVNLQKVSDSLEVPVKLLENLSSCAGEITVLRNMVNKLVKGIERQYTGNKDVQTLVELLDEMHKINGSIQGQVTDLRKVPLSSICKTLPRMVRDLARDLGKSINLEIIGDKIRVDNALARVCNNSLLHLVRNSADHGIEAPAQRKAAGKPEKGSIRIEFRESAEEITILIVDDGAGIDPQKIAKKAAEKGLCSPQQLAAMTESQILALIFASGFSTASVVSDVSGRGVGMDMVKSSVESVQGEILIDARLGQGSTFTIKLPIPKSVVIYTSLLIDCGGQTYAVPQEQILRVVRIEKDLISSLVQKVSQGQTLCYRDRVYPLIVLSDVIGPSGGPAGSELSKINDVVEILIIQLHQLTYALQIDAIYDAEEIVLKPLPSCFNSMHAFLGATFLGDGTVGLILDTLGIAQLAGIAATDQAEKENERIPLEAAQQQSKISGDASELQNFLVFELGTKATYGVPIHQVYRIEVFEQKSVQRSGAERVVVYRDHVLPLYSCQKMLKLQDLPGDKRRSDSQPPQFLTTIITKGQQGLFGMEIERIVDISASESAIDTSVRDRSCVLGNACIKDKNVTIVDFAQLATDYLAS